MTEVVGLDDGAPDGGVVATGSPALSWQLRDAASQLGYELALDGVSAGAVDGPDQLDVAWPFAPLRSRERRAWRVRVRTATGWSRWSDPRTIEAGLLADADWQARPIAAVDDPGRTQAGPALRFRREFDLPQLGIGRLYLTALGVVTAWLNDRPVGDHLLAPGWTDYRRRLRYDTHDVTALLRPGRNVLLLEVGDGWYRGDLGFVRRRNWYGDRVAALAQLELDGAVAVATDASWRVTVDGPVRAAGLYDGAVVDRRPRDLDWAPVETLALPAGLAASTVAPVRVVERVTTTPENRLDFGQNLTGHVALRVRGPAGAVVTVRHAEIREPDGALHTAALRTARAADRYVLTAGEQTFVPPFTSHGFRYADVDADPGVELLDVAAEVVHTDLRPTGEFACSDPLVTKLHRNIVWSQRGNFVSIPTDCPQRDERLGWTGDIAVFAESACHNYDVRAFLSSWLEDLAGCQRADGAVGSIVPDVDSDWPRAYGAAGWGDAAVDVPWALYEAYGDRAVLARQYPSMRAWVDYCAGRLDADGLWVDDPQWGDWLDPDAPPGHPERAKADAGLVATACAVRSARRLAAVATVLGKSDDATRFSALADRSAAAAWRRWAAHAVTSQTGCALALRYGLAPAGQRAAVAAALVALTQSGGHRIGTGFLGTPQLLPALTDAGRVDVAYAVLLNRAPPSWLYQVEQGATTVWERWDALRPDGSVHTGELDGLAGGMLSFNHYAYGAVDAWLHRVAAGLAPAAPGYREIRFAPRPGGGITAADARHDTRYGPAAIAWQIADSRLIVDLEAPAGTTARFQAPPECGPQAPRDLEPGRHRLELAWGQNP